MKVGELILKLSRVDPNTEVIMSKDGEGNSYNPLPEIIDNYTFVFGGRPKLKYPIKECSGYLYGNKYNNYDELVELCKWVRVTPRQVLNGSPIGDFDIGVHI